MAGRNITAETGSEIPKQMWKIGYETVIGRTIRLLKKVGVKDIAISTNNEDFKQFGLKLLKHHNEGPWINAFYPTDDPVCYMFGDVVYSEEAIRTIVETETDSIQFFASAPPFAKEYPKRWAEPFAFKVVNQKYFRECINFVRKGIQEGIWKRDPIAWELWQVIKKTPLNKIDYSNYIAINDFTCDVDKLEDLSYYKDMGRFENTQLPTYMIHACPKRMWYVDDYLIPSMLEQGIKKEQILLYNDIKQLGNLHACMQSFLTLSDDYNGTWHLQDDVLLCKDFKQRTEQNDKGLVAGFISNRWNNDVPFGDVRADMMPWTFPCIRIPNDIAQKCARWVLSDIVNNPVYAHSFRDGNGDDLAFKMYLQTYHKDKKIRVLEPSLVEHIDWLIGGSSVGSKRLEPTVARRFDDQDLVEELEKRLCKREK